MSFWIKYTDYRHPDRGYIESDVSNVSAGPFKYRNQAEEALIILCGNPHFRGGRIDWINDEQIDPCAPDKTTLGFVRWEL